MSFKRSYEDGCAAAHALDLVGERWALLVVRELAFGAKRFTDLRLGLPGISPNVLTQRLEELERAGVLRRRRLLPPAATWVYELTDWGRELGPILMALGRWGARSPLMEQGLAVSTASLMMSMQTLFSAERAGDFSATLTLRLDEERFLVVVAGGEISVSRGDALAVSAAIAGTPAVLAQVLYGDRKLSEAVNAGELSVEGDKAAVRRFVTLFEFPATAARPAA